MLRKLLNSISATKCTLAGSVGEGGIRWASSQASPSVQNLRSALGYCVDQVRTSDYDNYVWAVQLPPEIRSAVITLRAFNVETAAIAQQARTEMLVMMRHKWWRDAVNSCFKGQPPAQPVMTALADILTRHKLTRYRLQRLVTTRENDLTDASPPASLQALEEYAEGTASQLLYLHLEAAGVSTPETEHAASHLGKAVGIASLLRGAVPLAKLGRTYLPIDLCEEKKVAPEDVLHAEPSEGIKDVTLAVAAAAKAHLEHARSFAKDLPPVARQLMLPSVACDSYLQALEAANFDMFSPSLLKNGGFSPLGHQLRVKWHLLRGTY